MKSERYTGDWPVEYQKELVVGDPLSPVAVCALWSERDYVAGQLGIENVAVIGNLYSHGPGIEGMVRNILANPAIRVVVIAGKDKSRSAGTLLNFFRAGVEETDLGWTIASSGDVFREDPPAGMRTIDGEVPYKAIELLRTSVQVVDLRGMDWEEVRRRVMSYGEADLPPFAEPTVYPKSGPKIEVLGGEDIGFVFRGRQPEEVWLEILRTVRQFGSGGESRYTSGTQELLNVMAVIDGDIEQMMSWPGWVGHSPEAVREYSEQLIGGVKLDADDTYAYGERMRLRQGDQIGVLINKLRKNPNSRGFVIDLWDVAGDFMRESGNPPCLTQAWFRVYRGRLCANFNYRSHDMYGAWIKNAMGDRLLQAFIANEAGIPLGSTTVVSGSAHIYAHDFAQVDGLLKDNPLKWRFTEDPRGNVIVGTEQDRIVVRHENSFGAVTMLSGKTARELYKKLWEEKLISLTDHALYVGYELARAEEAVKSGREYNQDMA